MRTLAPACLLVLALASLPACGGGGGGGGTPAGATADLLIGDAPVDDLLSFSAVVQSVRLQREDLTFTGDLIGSLEVEFLGLNGAFAFLGKKAIPAGTYVAVEIGFAHGQYHAKADDGSPVTVVASDDTFLAALPAPLTVASGEYVRFTVDLDLLSSLSGSVSSGSIDFGPDGSCDSNDGSEDAPLDELRGSVVSSDFAQRTVVVNGTVGSPAVSIGRVTVHVGDGTVLLDNDNAELSVGAFFGALAAGTLLEVHGDLGAGGVVEATRIELEDAGGGASVARIAGVVNSVGTGTFQLRIAEIKDGEALVQPVLDALGEPAAIDCAFDGGTSFTFDTGGLASSDALAPGQEVKVRFSAFDSEPFPASEVEIDDTPGLHGTLTGTRSGALLVRLDARETPVLEGAAADARTEVSVELGAAPILLAVPGAPHLAARELGAGARLELRGRLTGTPQAPVLAAERVLVRPGYLRRARLVDLAPTGDDLVLEDGELVDSFGPSVRAGLLRAWLQPGCRFSGAARSPEELRALVQRGTRVELDVLGLAGEFPGELRAYAVRIRAD